jgi:PhnB protein
MQPNLLFNGNAEDVLNFYRDAFGGELNVMRFAGSPVAEGLPEEWGSKVLYGTLNSPFGTLNAMDAPPGRGPKSTEGNIMISVLAKSEADIDKAFAKLAAGGEVMMPLGETFWAKRFGMVADKFGTRWMISYGMQ